MQSTIVYSEPCLKENQESERASCLREPGRAASHKRKRAKTVSELTYTENHSEERAVPDRELS